MDKLASGVALAALSALTFLAYKHYSAFRILGCIVLGALLLGQAVALAYDIGAMHGFLNTLKFVDAGRMQEAKIASDEAKLITLPIFAAWTAACVYVGFLFYLPQLLGDQKPPNQQEKPKRK
jgi:hypothetical protein